jgi:type I restriction enzyme S subunit
MTKNIGNDQFPNRKGNGNWEQIKLKDIAVKRNKKNKDSIILTVFSNSALNGIIEQTDFFDKDIANKDNLNSYYIVEKNDFVYNPRISSLAPYGPINRNKTNKTGVVSPLYTVFRLESQKCCLDYFEQYFKSSCWHKYMYSVANYGARSDRMNITDNDFFNMALKVPQLSEQKKIASILSTWDKAIELKEKLIEQKKEQKKGLMQKLLTGEVILPGFKGEWKEYKLGNLTDISTGNKDTKDKVDDGKYPFFVRSETVERINSYSYDGEAILIPGDGKIGQIYHYINGKFDFHQRVYKISDFDEKCCGKFIFYYLQHYFYREAMKYTAKATVDSLRLPMLTGMLVRLPEKAEQIKIVKILDAMEAEINLLNQELKELKQQKKGLMQLLLTGKVRVKV